MHVDVWLPVRLDRVQEILSPSGDDAVVKSTVPAKPPVDRKEIVVDRESPAAKEREDGFASREKSGCGTGVTVTSIDALWLRFPLVPVVVTVYEAIVVEFTVHTDD